VRRLLFGVFALAAAMYAADVTGTWAGPVAMKRGDETKDDTAHLVLKQDGAAVTGTMGPSEDRQHTITKGSVDGNNVHLEALVEGENKIVLDLKLVGEKLTGDLKTEGPTAPPMTGKMTLEKKK
jgi:hypothetical protein